MKPPTALPSGRGRYSTRVFGWIRDGWLIVGLAIALFLILEASYRAQGAARRGLRSGPEGLAASEALHPYAGQEWWANWSRDLDAGGISLYDPYRGWWRGSYASPTLTVDSAGRRRTVNGAAAGPHARRILMLGGSTMWGFTARDSATIPSRVAANLRARGVTDVAVENLAQSGFNVTQGVITLLLQLRDGRVPDVVVFLDGNNEIATTFESGEPGHVFGEGRTANALALGRRGLAGELVGLGRHSELIQRLRRMVVPPERTGPAAPDAAAVCAPLADQYANATAAGAALARSHGFHAVFLWQPLRATTAKPLTSWERSIESWPGYREMLRSCTAAADRAMGDRLGRDYFQLAGLFDLDTTSVFLDEYGHVTEAANTVIADRITEIILPLLAADPKSDAPAP